MDSLSISVEWTNGDRGAYNPQRLELVSEECSSEKPTPSFKFGEKVRLRDWTGGYPYRRGEVRAMDLDDPYISVMWENGEQGTYSPDRLESIPGDCSEKLTPSVKIGDKVRTKMMFQGRIGNVVEVGDDTVTVKWSDGSRVSYGSGQSLFTHGNLELVPEEPFKVEDLVRLRHDTNPFYVGRVRDVSGSLVSVDWMNGGPRYGRIVCYAPSQLERWPEEFEITEEGNHLTPIQWLPSSHPVPNYPHYAVYDDKQIVHLKSNGNSGLHSLPYCGVAVRKWSLARAGVRFRPTYRCLFCWAEAEKTTLEASFKVGDRVRLKGDRRPYNPCGTVASIGVIQALDSRSVNEVKVKWDNGTVGHLPVEKLEFLEEWTSEYSFKVGDIVHRRGHLGDIGVVKALYAGELDTSVAWNNSPLDVYRHDDLELLCPEDHETIQEHNNVDVAIKAVAHVPDIIPTKKASEAAWIYHVQTNTQVAHLRDPYHHYRLYCDLNVKVNEKVFVSWSRYPQTGIPTSICLSCWGKASEEEIE